MKNRIDHLTERAADLIKNSNVRAFLYKLRHGFPSGVTQDKYDWELSKTISQVLCNLDSSLLPDESDKLMLGTVFSEAAGFIDHAFRHNKTKPDLFDFAKILMKKTRQLAFAYEVNSRLRNPNMLMERLFSKEQCSVLAEILIERMLEEEKEKHASPFESLSYFPVVYLFGAWAEIDKTVFERYVNDYLDKDDANIVTLIQAHVPMEYSSSLPKAHKADLTEAGYQALSIYGYDNLCQRITAYKSVEELEAAEPDWITLTGRALEPINMLRQFIHFHNTSKSPSLTQTAIV